MAQLNLKVAALTAAAFLAGSMACPLQAQNSPVGSWDFVLSGPQRGVLQLTFNNDFTLDGVQIITEKPKSTHQPDEVDVRTPGGDERGFDDNASSTTIRLYGGSDVEGTWTYDTKGRVIGVFSEIGANLTNGITFTATVRPTVRMNMVGHRLSSGRRISYRGVPLTAVANIAGDYYASGIRNGKPFTELLTLTPGAGPNNFDLIGVGPAYDTVGFVLVSPQKHVAVYTESSENTNGILRAVTGPFNPTTGAAKSLLGLSQDPNDPSSPIKALNVRTSLIKQ